MWVNDPLFFLILSKRYLHIYKNKFNKLNARWSHWEGATPINHEDSYIPENTILFREWNEDKGDGAPGLKEVRNRKRAS